MVKAKPFSPFLGRPSHVTVGSSSDGSTSSGQVLGQLILWGGAVYLGYHFYKWPGAIGAAVVSSLVINAASGNN